MLIPLTQALAVHSDYILRSEILKNMKERWYNLTTDGWHSLIVGLLRDGQYEMALDKLDEMQKQHLGIQPWLYDIFVYELCQAEEVEEALRILQYRVDHGDGNISANVWNYMLECCSRSLYV